jgi:hypothetical protein
MDDAFDQEHTRLRRELAELQREHDEIEHRDSPQADHRAHARRLRERIAEVQASLARLKDREPPA